MKKLLWYYGRLQTWMSAILIAGNIPENIANTIKVDFERARNAHAVIPQCENDLALKLGIMVSWAESLEEGLPPAERVKVGRLLDEIKQHQKEFFG